MTEFSLKYNTPRSEVNLIFEPLEFGFPVKTPMFSKGWSSFTGRPPRGGRQDPFRKFLSGRDFQAGVWKWENGPVAGLLAEGQPLPGFAFDGPGFLYFPVCEDKGVDYFPTPHTPPSVKPISPRVIHHVLKGLPGHGPGTPRAGHFIFGRFQHSFLYFETHKCFKYEIYVSFMNHI